MVALGFYVLFVKGTFVVVVPITTRNITEGWEQEDEGENQFIFLLEERVGRVCALGVGTDASSFVLSFSAGCVALPALINIKAVIEQRQCTGVWNQKDELPVSSIDNLFTLPSLEDGHFKS